MLLQICSGGIRGQGSITAVSPPCSCGLCSLHIFPTHDWLERREAKRWPLKGEPPKRHDFGEAHVHNGMESFLSNSLLTKRPHPTSNRKKTSMIRDDVHRRVFCKFLTTWGVVLTLLLPGYHGEGTATSCSDNCAATYVDLQLIDLCTTRCLADGDDFAVEYPYLLGPVEIRPYPELTSLDADEVAGWTGNVWSRVSWERERIQFKYSMDSNPTPFFPYSAMHLHAGALTKDEIGGPILTHISGQGDLPVCVSLSFVAPFNFGFLVNVCSDDCAPGSAARGGCSRPWIQGTCFPCFTLAVAGFCRGGCQGDFRIAGNSTLFGPQIVVPSRACDIGRPDRPSNTRQNVWIQGLNSVEFSGNPDDGDDYSPYSIGIPENFDLWCTERNPYLVDLVFGPGRSSYVALHANINATGLSSLLYGDAFAPLSTAEEGPTNCYIFGNANYPCTMGLGELPGLGDPM